MSPVRYEEVWARRVVASTVGVSVTQYDDGSRNQAYDLKIEYPDRPHGAVEVTMAADPEAFAFWRRIDHHGGRWIEPALVGGWAVSIEPRARVNTLRADLPLLLADLENAGIRELRTRYDRRGPFTSRAASMFVTDAIQNDTSFPGSIYPMPDLGRERTGGMVPDDGDHLAEWVSDYLAREDRADVADKLRDAGTDETHAFIVVPPFAEAPFTVAYMLMSDDVRLPTRPPRLPTAISEVWVMSTWSSGCGYRWRGDSWVVFDKNVDSEAHAV